jgi:hypothetical protein
MGRAGAGASGGDDPAAEGGQGWDVEFHVAENIGQERFGMVLEQSAA